MKISYKRLWKLLIDREMMKKELGELAHISPATLTKMGKGGHITTEVIIKICETLNCKVEDIMEVID